MPPAAAIDAEALFQTHHDRIYRYVLRMVKQRAEAEDLTQDTFIRALRASESLRDPEAVVGWLYRIATRVCLDYLRQPMRRVSLDDEQNAALSAGIAAPAEPLIIERKETSACVQRCLGFLSDTDRAVLLLHLGQRLTAQEIADLLGLQLTTVKMRLHRARTRLAEVMKCGCAVSTDKGGHPVCEPKRFSRS